MLIVPVRTVRMTTWQGRTIMVTWQVGDVANAGWLFVGEYDDETCPFWANDMRTRGPTRGRHVSLIRSSLFLCVKVYWESVGFDPRTSPLGKDFIPLR